MNANRLIHRTPFLIAAGLVAFSVPAYAQDSKLTPYERSLMCKLTETCAAATGESAATVESDDSQSASTPSEVLDTPEAPFSVFSSGGAHGPSARPQAQLSARASRNGSGPKLYNSGQRRTNAVATIASARPAAGHMRSRTIVARRPNAGDMRVQFANGSDVLSAGDFPELSAWAHGLQSPEFAHLRIRIEGHTNAVGNRDYNLGLSERRAKAVGDYLTAHGISQDRIDAKGYGFDKPRIEGAPGDALNRRVEIIKVN